MIPRSATRSALTLMILLAAPSSARPEAPHAASPPAPETASVPTDGGQGVRLDMEQAVRLATAHSPLTRRAEAGRAAAAARRTAAKRRFLPRVGLQASYTRLSHVEPGTVSLPFQLPGTDTSGMQLGEAIDDRARLRLTVDQPLYQGGKLFGGLRAAKRAVALEETRARHQQADLRETVERTYLGVLRARAGGDVAATSVRVLRQHDAKVQQLVAAGRATALERDVVRASLAEAQAGLLAAQANVAAAEDALRILLGLPPDAPLVLTEPLDAPAGDAPTPSVGAGAHPSPDAALRAAIERRTELDEARAAVRVREAKAEIAQGALLPSAVLRLGYTFANPNERWFPPKVQWKGSWDATVALSWSWGWGAAWHEAEAARQEARQARLTLAALEDQTRVEVRQALAALQGAQGQVAAMRVAVEAREAALRRAQAWYGEGRSTSTDVIDRQADLARAQHRLVEAQVTRQLALLRLRRLGALAPPGEDGAQAPP